MPAIVTAVVAALVGYGLGCISTGYYLVQLRTGQDLRQVGSGATGGRNAGRVLGTIGFLATGGGDLAKSALAVLLPMVLGWGPAAIGAAMVGVTAGHIWPAQLGFRGGRGVAPFVGTMALVAPVGLAAGAVAGLLFAGLSRRLYLGGLAGLGLAPVATLIFGAPLAIVAGSLITFALLVAGHRAYLWDEVTAAASRSIAWFARGGGADG